MPSLVILRWRRLIMVMLSITALVLLPVLRLSMMPSCILRLSILPVMSVLPMSGAIGLTSLMRLRLRAAPVLLVLDLALDKIRRQSSGRAAHYFAHLASSKELGAQERSRASSDRRRDEAALAIGADRTVRTVCCSRPSRVLPGAGLTGISGSSI